MFKKLRLNKALKECKEAYIECINASKGKFIREFTRATGSTVNETTYLGRLCISVEQVTDLYLEFYTPEKQAIAEFFVDIIQGEQLNAIGFVATAINRQIKKNETFLGNIIERIASASESKNNDYRSAALIYMLLIGYWDRSIPSRQYKLIGVRELLNLPQLLAKVFINTPSLDGSSLSERVNQEILPVGSSYMIEVSPEVWKITSQKEANVTILNIENPEQQQKNFTTAEVNDIYNTHLKITTERKVSAIDYCLTLKDTRLQSCLLGFIEMESDLAEKYRQLAESGEIRADYVYKYASGRMLGKALNEYIGTYIRYVKLKSDRDSEVFIKMQAAALAVIGYYHNHSKYYFAGESGRYDTLIEEISRKLDDDENFFGDLMNVDKIFPAWVWAKEFKEDFLQAMRTLALDTVNLGVLSMEKDFLGLNISYPANDFYIFAGSQIPELASPGYFSTFKPPYGEY